MLKHCGGESKISSGFTLKNVEIQSQTEATGLAALSHK